MRLRDIVEIGALAVDLLPIRTPYRHPPKRIADLCSCFQQAVGNCVVVTVERLELGSQRDARRTCQRRTIQQEIGPLAVGLCQCIEEHESPIRIRVADLDCLGLYRSHR